ncbi:MAG: TlpA family protein disulfide reductase [Nitrospirae bacterium]|nr:TlpA family protein disulfide reductase [Nitrospirota bacterium]
MKKYLIILIILLTSNLIYAAPPAPWEADDIVGKNAPDFTLNSIEGKKIKLSVYKGKTILLNFWATWCGPCQEEIPAMNQLLERFKKKGFIILAVSIDDDDETVSNFLKNTAMNFTILRDPEQKIARSSYKVFGYPFSFLINKKGIIVKRYIGAVDWIDSDILNEISGYLK